METCTGSEVGACTECSWTDVRLPRSNNAIERWQRKYQPYFCLWIIRGDQEPALAVDEVCDHLHQTCKQ